MEISRFDDVLGGVSTEDIPEGRFIFLTTHSETYDFGSREDLVGFKLPDTPDQAHRAKFCITWPVTNLKTPIVQQQLVPETPFAFALRDGGFDQTANVPFDTTVYLTYPGYTEGEILPSGCLALGFTEATVTLPYGDYVYDANIIVKGAAFEIADTASDGAASAGMPKYAAAMAVGVIGFVERFDTSTGALTLRIE